MFLKTKVFASLFLRGADEVNSVPYNFRTTSVFNGFLVDYDLEKAVRSIRNDHMRLYGLIDYVAYETIKSALNFKLIELGRAI